ncbi:hypothetical protein LJK87_18820 [Paenibacillus sp. P25]|nr:hypothetical protein LJK87_18820 [Paenibacillus sp. P25]
MNRMFSRSKNRANHYIGLYLTLAIMLLFGSMLPGGRAWADDVAPVPVPGIVQIAAGLSHTVALKSDGTVWSWGDNSHGKLGTPLSANRYVPTQIKELTDIVSISAGMNHTLALKKDGTVWSWGQNASGQVGDGEQYRPADASADPESYRCGGHSGRGQFLRRLAEGRLGMDLGRQF